MECDLLKSFMRKRFLTKKAHLLPSISSLEMGLMLFLWHLAFNTVNATDFSMFDTTFVVIL